MYRFPTIAALVALAVPLAIQAQDRKPVITGVVVTADGKPVAGAEVFVGRTDKPVTSNEQGRFRIEPAPSGRLWVAARRIGYSPIRRSLTITKGEHTELELVMDPLPVTLPELRVVEQSGMKVRRLNDFFTRARSGYGGRFITREDIEKRNPITLAHVVRPVLPYAALASWERSYADYGPGAFRSAGLPRTGRNRCAPAISVDGGYPSEVWNVEDIPVSEVEALEIYRPRWSEIPIEYSFGISGGRAQNCGLVVVWTR